MTLMGMALLLGVLFVSLCNYGVEGSTISKEEDVELERRAQLRNKSPVKTFQTEYGDIIDCIDINKQPAFDHPLLKNHKIQMRPSHLPKVTSGAPSTFNSSRILFKINGCPLGTIPIRRTQKEDLLREKSLPKRISFSNHSLVVQNVGQHFAIIRTKKVEKRVSFGAKAYINLYNPNVEANQASSAQLWIENGPLDQLDSIEVGWTVDPQLYGDTRTRLFTHWTSNKNGCYNTRCPGFIQVNKDVTLDTPFPSSIYDGQQFEIIVQVSKDPKTGDWWFIFTEDNVPIGYWPHSIFTHLNEGASDVAFGGKVVGPPNGPSPPMGNGYRPSHSFTRVCYFRQIKLVDESGALVSPNDKLLETYYDKYDCYYIEYYGNYDNYMENTFTFGGAGGGKCVGWLCITDVTNINTITFEMLNATSEPCKTPLS